MSYKPITFDEAAQKGEKAKATIYGSEYTGYKYQGYFFHKYKSTGEKEGNCKILVKFCEKVEKI